MENSEFNDRIHDSREEVKAGKVEAFINFDPADELDTIVDQLLENTMGMDRQKSTVFIVNYFEAIIEKIQEKAKAKAIQGCVGFLIRAKNAKLAAYGIAYAAGLQELSGLSMTSASMQLKVTKAAISKSAIQAADILGLPRSRYMKSEKASEAYRERQLEINRKKKNA